jgi:hypothetical protein
MLLFARRLVVVVQVVPLVDLYAVPFDWSPLRETKSKEIGLVELTAALVALVKVEVPTVAVTAKE